MKMLLHRTVGSAAVPFVLGTLADQARVNLGDDDATLTLMGWTAAAEIEHQAQIALLTQTVTVSIFDPDCAQGLRLPIGPVLASATLSITIDGVAFTDFQFVPGHRAYVHWGPSFANLTPELLEVEYPAGFGNAETDIPRDLRQALADQAALYYDARGAFDQQERPTSPHMARIVARYRGVQA